MNANAGRPAQDELDAILRSLPAEQPAADDDAGWRQIWRAGERAVAAGLHLAARDNDVVVHLRPILCEYLAALLDTGRLPPAERLSAGDALAELGDPRPGVCTLEPLLGDPIPAGEITLREKNETVAYGAFQVTRYPVTNAQFRMFVDDGGYADVRWWSDWGRRVQKKEAWSAPMMWPYARFNRANQPVIVSFFEAEAYAAWLTAQTGREYRLPTGAEWERAAGHTDGRVFAWGGEWADDHANTSAAKLGRPTTVGMFPRGMAACGARDMSGNVWEWTEDLDLDCWGGTVGRGGGFMSDQRLARVGYRRCFGAASRASELGFRLVSPACAPDA